MFNAYKFRELRKKKKISQSQLGKVLGKSRITIRNWEKCIHAPSVSDIRAAAHELGVSVSEISDLNESHLKKKDYSQILDDVIKELDSLMKVYGDIPFPLAKKMDEMKTTLIDYKEENIRLRRQVNRYDFLVQNLPFMIYTKNAENLKYRFVNDAFLVLIGPNHSKEDVVGTKSLSYFTHKDYIEVLEAEQKVINDKEKLNLDLIIPGTKGRKTGNFTIVPIVENGSVREIICSIKNITVKQ